MTYASPSHLLTKS